MPSSALPQLTDDAVYLSDGGLRAGHPDLACEPRLGQPGLAQGYGELHRILPDLRVVGGCCGTDDAHVAAIAKELIGG